MKKNIFIPRDNFTSNEWILRYKVMSLLIMSFLIGIMIFCFSIYRFTQGLYVLASMEFAFAAFLFIAFVSLRKNKNYYTLFAKIFFVFVYVLLILIFLYTPQNATRFHWIPVTLVLIFFLLDTKGGLLFLFLYLLFIFYLILTDYPYTTVEYITWITSFSALGLVMYFYEKIKENEKILFLQYTNKLQEEVDKKTHTLAAKNKELEELNDKLEERVEEGLEQRIEQEKMLLRQCRMANMGEMIDAIAHQWRQPLMNINAILMNIDILTDKEIREGKELQKSMQEIASLTAHMSQTIEDFRTFYHEEKEKSIFVLYSLIKEVLVLMKNVFQDIKVDIRGLETIKIKSFKTELTQVLITILSNAKETFIAREIRNRLIVIEINEDDKFIYISILDNAGGIRKSDFEKVFDPYFTTKKQTGGTGLGLYIAKIIVENNMQGSITVSNERNGAKFTLKLPKFD
jgi:signal transduction histidine kinase